MLSNNIYSLISADIAWQYKIIPEKFEYNKLTVFIDREIYNKSHGIEGELELISGYEINIIEQDKDIIEQLLLKFYRKDLNRKPEQKLSLVDENNDDFLSKIINEAKELKSSDIHIEGYSSKCRIRLRIDGKLIERYTIPKDQYASFVNKIKIKANLDIAEKRLPQDGRILIINDTGRSDIRVSVVPSLYGEKIVLRLLGSDSSHLSLNSLGLDNRQYNDILKILKRQQGIILISGPTGSGKTTTLYSILKELNSEQRNILTIEDPIEYTLDGINQVQVRENIGLTFSSALRTFLRQDPDIIMLGEIRDNETAQMAIRAALTGHLVLSTIHTNSAWGTVARLADMGVPTYLLAGTLNMTIAQRLLRKLCTKCKKEESFSNSELNNDDIIRHFENSRTHYVPVGCNNCFHTGYSGRVAIYEAIPVDSEISGFVKDNISDVSQQLKKRNIHTLQQSAIELVNNSITSIEEIYPILLNH